MKTNKNLKMGANPKMVLNRNAPVPRPIFFDSFAFQEERKSRHSLVTAYNIICGIPKKIITIQQVQLTASPQQKLRTAYSNGRT